MASRRAWSLTTWSLADTRTKAADEARRGQPSKSAMRPRWSSRLGSEPAKALAGSPTRITGVGVALAAEAASSQRAQHRVLGRASRWTPAWMTASLARCARSLCGEDPSDEQAVPVTTPERGVAHGHDPQKLGRICCVALDASSTVAHYASTDYSSHADCLWWRPTGL